MKRTAQSGRVVWFTGLSAAGKTTLSAALCAHLRALGYPVEHLDGDEIRRGQSPCLGFSKEDRDENVRRIGETALCLARRGNIVIVSAMSPFRQARAELRARLPQFAEIYVNAPLQVCECRDPKNLYQQARAGLLRDLPGVDLAYEPPLHPEVECHTDREEIRDSLRRILDYLLPLLEGASVSHPATPLVEPSPQIAVKQRG